MLVQCPSCRTTYRVSEDVLTAAKPTFRCSRCKKIFVLGAAANSTQERSEARSSGPQPQPSRELSFSFDESVPGKNAPEAVVERSESTAVGVAPAPASEQPSFILPKKDEQWSIERRFDDHEERFTRGEKPVAQFDKPAEQPFQFGPDLATIAKQIEPRGKAGGGTPSRPLSVRPYFALCALVLLSFSAIALIHKANPAPIENFLKGIPWFGSAVLRNDHLRQGVVLQTARPGFQRIQRNQEVFLLSGIAVNRNRVRVREVKIEGYLFGSDGKVLERQVITVGNAISPKIVRDLTAQEIFDLQKQGPVKRFEMLPDESAPFSIVFLKPNRDVKSFGYRVLSADES